MKRPGKLIVTKVKYRLELNNKGLCGKEVTVQNQTMVVNLSNIKQVITDKYDQ